MFGDERTDWFGVRLGNLSFKKTFDEVDIPQYFFSFRCNCSSDDNPPIPLKIRPIHFDPF